MGKIREVTYVTVGLLGITLVATGYAIISIALKIEGNDSTACEVIRDIGISLDSR